MLVLTRKLGEVVKIGTGIEVQVLEVDPVSRRVRLGVTAPKEVPVHRKEVWDQIKREQTEDGK